MQIPLISGRFFSEQDNLDTPQVAIIDQKFAQRFWPHGDAVGKHLWFDPKKPITIVGVVGVVKQYGLDTDGKIAMYFPVAAGSRSGHVPGGAFARHDPRLANAIDPRDPRGRSDGRGLRDSNHAGPLV